MICPWCNEEMESLDDFCRTHPRDSRVKYLSFPNLPESEFLVSKVFRLKPLLHQELSPQESDYKEALISWLIMRQTWENSHICLNQHLGEQLEGPIVYIPAMGSIMTPRMFYSQIQEGLTVRVRSQE